MARRWTHVATAAGVAVVLLLPWVDLQRRPLRSAGAVDDERGTGRCLGANCDETYYGPAQGGWSLFCVVNDPFNDRTRIPRPGQRGSAARPRAIARDHLSRLPIVAVKRVGRTLDLFALGNLVHEDVGEDRERWASWAGIVSFWVLAPLAAFGAVKTRRRDRAVLLIPVMIVLATTVAIYGGHRIRSSAEPAIVVFAAIAIDRLTSRRRQLSDSRPADRPRPARRRH